MELLIVIAIIATLAALIFPAAAALKRKAVIKRVQGEMKFIESAIDTYKENLKQYPPENPVVPADYAINPLYYELGGTKLVNGEYQPLSGQGNIAVASLGGFFGAGGVTGFLNVTKGSDDEQQAAKNCLSGLRPAQYLEVMNGGVAGIVLGSREKGPLMLTDAAGQTSINPWRYANARATNNPGRYDLWIDVLISGKSNRFCNWSDTPYPVFEP